MPLCSLISTNASSKATKQLKMVLMIIVRMIPSQSDFYIVFVAIMPHTMLDIQELIGSNTGNSYMLTSRCSQFYTLCSDE